MSERATVIDTGVNVRSGPGTKYAIVDKLDKKDTVTVIERNAHWVHVRPDNGSKRGWVHSASLRTDRVLAPESPKVAPAPAPTPAPAPPPPPDIDEPLAPIPQPHDDGSVGWFIAAAAVCAIVALVLWLIN